MDECHPRSPPPPPCQPPIVCNHIQQYQYQYTAVIRPPVTAQPGQTRTQMFRPHGPHFEARVNAIQVTPPRPSSPLVQATSAWSVKTRRAPSRKCRDTRVHGHTYDYGHAWHEHLPDPPPDPPSPSCCTRACETPPPCSPFLLYDRKNRPSMIPSSLLNPKEGGESFHEQRCVRATLVSLLPIYCDYLNLLCCLASSVCMPSACSNHTIHV